MAESDPIAEIKVVGDFTEFDREMERRQAQHPTARMDPATFGTEGTSGSRPTAPSAAAPQSGFQGVVGGDVTSRLERALANFIASLERIRAAQSAFPPGAGTSRERVPIYDRPEPRGEFSQWPREGSFSQYPPPLEPTVYPYIAMGRGGPLRAPRSIPVMGYNPPGPPPPWSPVTGYSPGLPQLPFYGQAPLPLERGLPGPAWAFDETPAGMAGAIPTGGYSTSSTRSPGPYGPFVNTMGPGAPPPGTPPWAYGPLPPVGGSGGFGGFANAIGIGASVLAARGGRAVAGMGGSFARSLGLALRNPTRPIPGLGGATFFTGMFGLWEASQMTHTLRASEFKASIAETPHEALESYLGGIEGATSGPLMGMSAFLDEMFTNLLPKGWRKGLGITSVSETLRTEAARSKMLDTAMTMRVQTQGMRTVAAATTQGNDALQIAQIQANLATAVFPLTATRAQLNRNLSNVTDPGIKSAINTRINEINSSINAQTDMANRQIWMINQEAANRQSDLYGRRSVAAFSNADVANRETAALTAAQNKEIRDYTLHDPQALPALMAAHDEERKQMKIRIQRLSDDEGRQLRYRKEFAEAVTSGTVSQSGLEELRQQQEDEDYNIRLQREFPALVPQARETQLAEANQRSRDRATAMRKQLMQVGMVYRPQVADMARQEQVLQLQLQNRVLDARIQEVTNQEQTALEAASLIPSQTWRERLTERIKAGANLARARVNQQWNQETELINIGLQTNQAILAAREARSPESGTVAGIVGQARLEAARFVQAGRPEAAATTLDQSLTALRLERRDYLEQFRAQQIDLSKLAVDNPRDVENPTQVLGSIDQAVQQILQTMIDLVE